MNAEEQIIGSLLLDQTRIEDMHDINSEMFTDDFLGNVFRLYENANGKEINQLVISDTLKSDFWTVNKISNYLGTLVFEHDAGISDKSCIESINNRYRAKKLNEFLDHIQITENNIDKVINELGDNIKSLDKVEEIRPKTLADLTALKTNYFVEKKGRVFKTGFDVLDNAIAGIDDGDLIIIAARPAVGKSAFSLQIMRKFGRDGYKVGNFNLEMQEKQIYERSVAASSGLDMSRIRLATNFLNNEKTLFDEGNALLEQETNVYVFTGIQTVNSIRSAVKKYGLDIVFIDYLQLIEPVTKRQNRATEVADITRGLKAIAGEFKIPIVALSQINRVSEMLKDKEPSMSELRESGAIEQDAAVIIMLWDDINPETKKVEGKFVKVEKSRNGQRDRTRLYFDGKHMTFSALDIAGGEPGQEDTNFEDAEDTPFVWN